jgi:hypothetical protein
MHVNHARVLQQRIVRVRIDADDIAGVRTGFAKPREVIAPGRSLGFVEESARDGITLLVESVLGTLVDHDCRAPIDTKSNDVVNSWHRLV